MNFPLSEFLDRGEYEQLRLFSNDNEEEVISINEQNTRMPQNGTLGHSKQDNRNGYEKSIERLMLRRY